MSRVAHLPVRWSWLRHFAASAAHALEAATNGREPSLAMKLGTAGHAAALEPHRLAVFRPGTFIDGKGKTKSHSGHRRGEAWDKFRAAQKPDAVIVSESELRRVSGMAAALRAADAERVHPDTGEPLPLLFGPGVLIEQTILWSVNGRAYSSTPDARLPGRWIADLKVVRTGDPERYPRDSARMGYPSQLVMYDEADAYERTGDHLARSCELFSVTVESTPPHVVTTYRLAASAVSAGERALNRWREALAAAEASDSWPGYCLSVVNYEVDDPLAALDGLTIPDDDAPEIPDDESDDALDF